MLFSLYDNDQSRDIPSLFTQTFSDSEGQAEGALIGQLAFELLTQTPGKAVYCFVAIEAEQVVGAIIFSRLFYAAGQNAFIMAPVAVKPEFQGQGIGQKLIRFGLRTLKEKGVAFVVTYGDPNFYQKTGFSHVSESQLRAPHPLSFPEGWLAQSLTAEPLPSLSEKPTCVSALAKPAYW